MIFDGRSENRRVRRIFLGLIVALAPQLANAPTRSTYRNPGSCWGNWTPVVTGLRLRDGKRSGHHECRQNDCESQGAACRHFMTHQVRG